MITLYSAWWLEWLGHFHPLAVHFPIGLLIGALILEVWPFAKRKNWNVSGMVYLGAVSAIISALLGWFLQMEGGYEGELISAHQLWGFITAALSGITAVIYAQRDKLPARLPVVVLSITCVSIAVAGHFGASITHGEDYLFPSRSSDYDRTKMKNALAEFTQAAASDTLTDDQLDKLNLQVRAIFAHNCIQCHSTAKQKGGLVLDHEEGVFAGGDNGSVLVKGDASSSEMIRRLRLPRSDEESMPPKGKVLADEEIEILALWIDEGAHWAEADLKVFREAELTLTRPDPPHAPGEITHPIDQFVHNYFLQNNIGWPELIDDRRFIRRAYMDVKGVLPTPEEGNAFLDDKSPDKRRRLVDQLLEDRQSYTLNWLSFWNDILRNDYSGTGFITGGRKQITDWLYHSLLEHKPYNQMVAELVNPQPESEGFIKGIEWRGVVNASQRTELQAAQNISQSLLGLNLKCASCHNSFINNLTLDEAYGFANIFAREPLEINRCDKPTGRMAQTAFLYPELGQVDADSMKDRLEQLADIIIKPENGRLYRTIVNRFWDRLFGRGIVAPVDEMDNIPWSQELLDWLASDFIENGYDFRHLLATIMTSRTYQLPAVPYPSPNYLTSESFVFQGPTLRRLTVEQFVDAFSHTITPFYYSVGYDPQPDSIEPNWIWHGEVEVDRINVPQPGRRLLRKTFSLNKAQGLISASVLISADDQFEFYFNGGKTGEGNDWRDVFHIDIPLDRIKENNVIAIAATNDGPISNPAGLLFTLRLGFQDSSFQYIYSDPTWKTTADTSILGWQEEGFNDEEWAAAHRYGRFRDSYWGVLLDYTFDKKDDALPIARASLVRQDPFMKSLGRPTRENVATQRDVEATLLQALTLTNSDFFADILVRGAHIWFDQYGDDPRQLIDQLYIHLLGRQPSKKEIRTIGKLYDKNQSPEQVEDIIWSLVNLPEFQFI